uniref:Uncharacterized protein n=1 Tax=Anguilla anguilla TaxID=7936 RepID=A0A0E9Y1I1_ANGAN
MFYCNFNTSMPQNIIIDIITCRSICDIYIFYDIPS